MNGAELESDLVLPKVRQRLLVLTSTYPRWPGDPEPGFVHELCKRLVKAFEVTVVAPHAPGARTVETMDGVHVHRFRYAPIRAETLVNDGGIVANLKRARWKWLLLPGFFLSAACVALRVARISRPTVVHAHWLIPQGLVAAIIQLLSARGPEFVVTSHGADLFALRAPLFVSIKRFVVSRAAKATVVSHSMVPEMTELSKAGNQIAVCSMGVDLVNRFVESSENVRSESQLLFVGRLVEKKGLRHLIAAMPLILQASPDAVLIVAGFGPEEESLRKQVQALGLQNAVSFIGPVKQESLPALYQRAAVTVAPFVRAADGDQEGLGLVAVEALGCGCPIVLGDVAAASEVKAIAPEMVAIVSVEAETLAEAVIRQMGVRAVAPYRRELESRFGWDGVAATYAELLQQVAVGSARVAEIDRADWTDRQ